MAFESLSLMCTRKRFSVTPYSLTSSFKDLFSVLPSFTLDLGVSIFVAGRRYSTPTTRVTIPTGRNEKKLRGSYPEEASVSLTIRFAGVPIRVIIPPILLANARGMSRRRGDVPADAAILTTIGSIRATVPVLLTNIPIAEVTNITRRKSLSSLFPARVMTLLPIIFASPV